MLKSFLHTFITAKHYCYDLTLSKIHVHLLRYSIYHQWKQESSNLFHDTFFSLFPQHNDWNSNPNICSHLHVFKLGLTHFYKLFPKNVILLGMTLYIRCKFNWNQQPKPLKSCGALFSI